MRWLVQMARQPSIAPGSFALRPAALAGVGLVALAVLLLRHRSRAAGPRQHQRHRDRQQRRRGHRRHRHDHQRRHAGRVHRPDQRHRRLHRTQPGGRRIHRRRREDRASRRGGERHHAAGRRGRPRRSAGRSWAPCRERIEVRAVAPLREHGQRHGRQGDREPAGHRAATQRPQCAGADGPRAERQVELGPDPERLLGSRRRALGDEHQRRPGRHQPVHPRWRHQQPELSRRHQRQPGGRRGRGVQGADQHDVDRVRVHRRRRREHRHQVGHQPVPAAACTISCATVASTRENAFAADKPACSSTTRAAARSAVRLTMPGLYDGTNRSFFFFNFEAWNFDREQPTTQTVPTDAHAARRLLRLARRQRAIASPSTIRRRRGPNPNGAGFIRDPFPNNIIPANRLDPVAQNILGVLSAGEPRRRTTRSPTRTTGATTSTRRATCGSGRPSSISGCPVQNTLSFRYNFYRHNADGGFSQSLWPDPIVASDSTR